MPSGDDLRPVFFLDRSLGGIQVPSLLREAHFEVVTLADHCGTPADELVSDVDWLELAGSRQWPVLMKDTRIRYRQPERAALISHGVQAFCLTNGQLRAAEMAEEFIAAKGQILDALRSKRPCLYAVRRGRITRLNLR